MLIGTDDNIDDFILPFLNNNPNVKKLNLCSNKITDKGAKLISYNKTLESLYLYNNKITSKGLNSFNTNNNKIKKLNVGSCSINWDDDISKSNLTLEKLIVFNTQNDHTIINNINNYRTKYNLDLKNLLFVKLYDTNTICMEINDLNNIIFEYVYVKPIESA